jgi:lipopolysaccharide/colanic/teichoic acid biosynthesis glycosyltransferase
VLPHGPVAREGRAVNDVTYPERVPRRWGPTAADAASRRRGGTTRGAAWHKPQRAFDIAAALLLLVAAAPLMLLTAVLVRLDSHGPVLYRQVRVGLHGKPFTLYKFRIMTVNAEAGGSPCWAQERDPRVTRIGGVIRSLRIDELPQLFNILAGQMSLIGPRPERPHFVEQLLRVIPSYGQRFVVRPGLTGWAQVNLPYGASVEDARRKLAYDLYYIRHRRVLLDAFILCATIRVILTRKGAR